MASATCIFSFANPVTLQWIGDKPQIPAGTSWGVPFAKGQIQKEQQFILTDKNNNQIPLQSWQMASYSDGSVKWMGFAASVEPEQTDGLSIFTANAHTTDGAGITVTEQTGEIIITNKKGIYIFGKSGVNLIKSIQIGETIVAENGRLKCILEDRSQQKDNILTYRDFTGIIEKTTLEQSGPVRAVVKIEGKQKAESGNRLWLPFTIRFYIYDTIEAVKMVHSFVYDGEQSEDFIKGLGITFDIPLREQMYNRHVRFSGEKDGLWSEPIQPLSGRQQIRGPENYSGMVYEDQIAGKRIPEKNEFSKQGQFLIDNWAVWSDFRLSQLSPDGFTIRKRTNGESAWIGTAGSNRSSGLVLAGDVSGGMAVSVKNFWQSYPAGLEVMNMRNDKAQLNIWLWSPEAEAMDLRHYDTEGHDLIAAYEDYQEGMSTPYGIARTHELTLYPFNSLPSKEATAQMARNGNGTVELMATPEYLHHTQAFGVWSLPDKSTPAKEWIENQIDEYITFYQNAIENHKWYGFWNFGDVMHSYNRGRHTWNYDIGGNAWANTELSPEIWLWLSFIRSGRADIYNMAINMTRHTSEVDMYHIGGMKGLGTRHNVSHWGCGAKEARVGQAWWKRYAYYLSTDERLGDIMHEAADADYAMLEYDPLRIAQPRTEYPTNEPTRIRWAPDWLAFAGNWFTEWERFGNEKYLEKIKTGMNCLASMPNGLFTGKGPLGYDPETGKLTYEGKKDWIDHSNHLANLMGGFEVMMEMYCEINHSEFNNTYLKYCKFYGLGHNDPLRKLKENKKYKDWWGHWNTPRLGAFAARELKDNYLAEKAWTDFFDSSFDREGNLRSIADGTTQIQFSEVLYPVDENPGIGTNGTSQWNINAIILLELIGDKIPDIETVKQSVDKKRKQRLKEQPPRRNRNEENRQKNN